MMDETIQASDWPGLVRSGGPVLIAVVIVAAILFLGYKYILAPSQEKTLRIAEEGTKSAEASAQAAEAHAEAAASNRAMGEANVQMAMTLTRLGELIFRTAQIGVRHAGEEEVKG